ncbi:DMT family transporter [Mangrovitalea sediminis]|uniref:DMT family transporter n=1 Tax=Mangrovitalea sediminis TaxID=1982043 RepID=UPI000BE53B5B|nr:DMT family transporter [Mangrovitalea sediminis]
MQENSRDGHKERMGLLYGFAGVFCFSLTLPATRVAVAAFDPVVVGLGRALVAAVLAALVLSWCRPAWPSLAQWRRLVLVAAGVVVGFPVLSAWAMTRVPAAHGAVVLGILPLATAVAATLRAGDRPSLRFWLAAIAGAVVVVGYMLDAGADQWRGADLLLIAAVASAAMGYAEGGRLSREMGGWQVICWALLLAAPVLVWPVGERLMAHPLTGAPWTAWLGLGYVCVFSMFLGFFAWYRGLALGGIARVSQMQLLQPFLTLMASGLLLGERVTWHMVAAAALVIGCILVGRRAPITASHTSGAGVGNR